MRWTRSTRPRKRCWSARSARTYGTDLRGKTLAVWGLAFKPRTDDIREAPALTLIDALLADGVRLQVHDPEAMANVRAICGDKLTYCNRPYDALKDADGLVIVTEWQEFRHPDFAVIRQHLRQPVIFDGRNLYDPKQLDRDGVHILRDRAVNASFGFSKEFPRYRKPGARLAASAEGRARG